MIFGALRVKNESRWIRRVVLGMREVCDEIIVLDDNSSDETPDICQEEGCKVIRKYTDDLNETQDKNDLLRNVWESGASIGDYVLLLDGDEILNPSDANYLIRATQSGGDCFSFPIVYLWDREDQVRVDRWYSTFHRPSLFRLTSRGLTFRGTGYGGNFHCGSVPQQLMGSYQKIGVRVLHLGYLHQEDRIRKYHWYNSQIPVPEYEDGYRHMVVGDLFPSTSRFVWAGPLELSPLSEVIR